jgi:hypothetical protein
MTPSPVPVTELPYLNVVLDLETLGLAEDAAILQIGCAIPGFQAHKLPNGVSPYFETTIAYEEVTRSEFSKDASTLDWWEKQSSAAKKSVFSGQNTYEESLHQLTFWFDTLKAQGYQIRLWGNGPEFDNRLLAYTLTAMGYKPQWKYQDNHSIRTLRLLYPIEIGSEWWPDEVRHTALVDASYEARIMDAIVYKYGIRTLGA